MEETGRQDSVGIQTDTELVRAWEIGECERRESGRKKRTIVPPDPMGSLGRGRTQGIGKYYSPESPFPAAAAAAAAHSAQECNIKSPEIPCKQESNSGGAERE